MTFTLNASSQEDLYKQIYSSQVIHRKELQENSSENLLELENAAHNKKLVTPPIELQLRADRQRYDARRKRFVAEGRVIATLKGTILKADRVEFDTAFKTLFARGRVRVRKGDQYFQASTFRYNLIQGQGELKDVYGVIDLKTKDGNRLKNPKKLLFISKPSDLNIFKEQKALRTIPKDVISPLNAWPKPRDLYFDSNGGEGNDMDDIACPTLLPKIPDWHPHPWSLTTWSGQMMNSNFGETLALKGKSRPEYLFGFGLQKRIYRSGPFSLELEADFFRHIAEEQPGGEFNQNVPFSRVRAQNFGEGVLGIGARLWLRPWISIGVVEGISYNTDFSNYERTYRRNYAKLLNYLSFEIETLMSRKLSLVGRIHHRSGAFRTFGGTKEGSNAYLLGLRYRWGKTKKVDQIIDLPPPLGCQSKTNQKGFRTGDNPPKEIDSVAKFSDTTKMNFISDGSKASKDITHLSQTKLSTLSLSEQEAIREKLISLINQKIDWITYRESLKIEGKLGVPTSWMNVDEQNKYEGSSISQLNRIGRTKFVTGSIKRWRVQAANVSLTPNGWESERMSFTNDPFTPTQTRIDAENVVAIQDEKGDLLIKSKRNRLIVEERLNIPILNNIRVKKRDDVENRWVFGIDNKDRDGFFVGRKLRPFALAKGYKLYLQPQFLLQRSINGKTNSYVASGDSSYGNKVLTTAKASDLVALRSELLGDFYGWNLKLNSNISTFNANRFLDGSRHWGSLKKDFSLPLISNVNATLFGAYRYKAWNGSLGETDIYSAYGGYLQKEGNFKFRKLNNNYLLRAGLGNYRAESFSGEDLSHLWRVNFYGAINSRYPIWRAKSPDLSLIDLYRYSPKPIVPGLTFDSNLRMSYFGYENGRSQNTISLTAGPTFTYGTFTKPYFDYTKLALSIGGTLKQGASPFDFDAAIDLGTLGIGLTQQIAGPLVINTGLEFNIDKGSDYFGKAINSKIELKWQRRTYDFGLYYNPYKGIGGMRIRLNDFNFKGKGTPFVPYESIESKDYAEF